MAFIEAIEVGLSRADLNHSVRDLVPAPKFPQSVVRLSLTVIIPWLVFVGLSIFSSVGAIVVASPWEAVDAGLCSSQSEMPSKRTHETTPVKRLS